MVENEYGNSLVNEVDNSWCLQHNVRIVIQNDNGLQ